MANNAARDENRIPTLLGASNVDGTPVTLFADPTTHRLLVDSNGAGSPLTTKGDLFTFSTLDARLPVGTDGQVLSADSAETTGLKWVVAGTGDMVLADIQTVTGAKTFNSGKLLYAGATSGTITLNATAVAGTNTLTLPAATDTLVGLATTDTLTNKTLTTPTIGDFTNSTHDHIDAAGGGILTFSNATTGTVGIARGGTGAISFAQGSILFGGALTIDENNAKFFWDDTNDRLGIGASNGTLFRTLSVRTFSALTSTVQQVARLTHVTSGTPVNGIGTGLEFETETAAGNDEIGATIEAITTDVTAASEDFDLVFKTMAGGTAAAERMRISSVGVLTLGTALAVDQGGTGQTTYTNGQLLIGNTTGNTLTKATLTQGNAITITNGGGSITIAADVASLTADGVVELATTAEIDTGTDSTRAMPVDQFVASDRNINFVDFIVVDVGVDVATGTTLVEWRCPFAGTIIQDDAKKNFLMAWNATAGVTGTMVIDIHLNGTTIMTTNKLDIETTEKTTADATTQPDLTTTAIAAGDIITIDVDAIHSGTAAKGLSVRLPIRQT